MLSFDDDISDALQMVFDNDYYSDLYSLLWGLVHREPIVQEAMVINKVLKADLAVQGVK